MRVGSNRYLSIHTTSPSTTRSSSNLLVAARVATSRVYSIIECSELSSTEKEEYSLFRGVVA